MNLPTEKDTACQKCGAPFKWNDKSDMLNADRADAEDFGIPPEERHGWLVHGECTVCDSNTGYWPRARSESATA